MGKMMASGEAVPLTALEGVTANQAETLAEHDIKDVEALATANLDSLVEYLDLTYDEAQAMIAAAAAIVAAKDTEIGVGEVAESDDSATAEAEAEVTTAEANDTPGDSTDEPVAEQEDTVEAAEETTEQVEIVESDETVEKVDEPAEGDVIDSQEGADVKDV
jgi:hypothetical protein